MNKRNAYILMMLLIPTVVFADKVKVRVFSTANIAYTKISFENSTYSLLGDNVDTIAANLTKGDFVELTPFSLSHHSWNKRMPHQPEPAIYY